MKHWFVFVPILILTGAALIFSEESTDEAPVGPAAVLYFIADTQRELSRLPVAFTRLSDQEEIRIGDRLASRYRAMLPQVPESDVLSQEVAAYVGRVGLRVAANAHRKLPYQFHYVPDSGFLNAFALPGGHVFIGAGLMALMDSEDQLAAVLGHEIEHIDHYHCAERVQLEATLRRIPLGELLELPVEVFAVGYSKTQELEADRDGTRLAVQGSYSPLGAIRMFQVFDRLFHEHLARSRTPQQELSQVIVQTLEGYFRSHPPASQRIAQIQNMITREGWEHLSSEQELQFAYVFVIKRAEQALASRHYEEAGRLARHSLQVRPDELTALQILAEAEFAQANFSEAADAYQRLLEAEPTNVEWLQTYSDALSAARQPQEAVEHFQDWLSRQRWAGSPQVITPTEVELAGLSLMTGNQSLASELIEKANAMADDWPAEAMGRLAWWYYRAGDYPAAYTLLGTAVKLRPQNQALRNQLGWVLIEQRDLEAAIQRLDEPMGLAIAHWVARNPSVALSYWARAVTDEPYWLNPRWTQSLYSPLARRSIEEMRAEQGRINRN